MTGSRPSSSGSLPQTSSFYKNNIDAAKTAQQDDRYRQANALYRSPSSASQRSRQTSQPQSNSEGVATIDVDQSIAQGLGESVSKETALGYKTANASRTSFGYGRKSGEMSRDHDEFHDANTFLPARDTIGRSTGSILPSAAFFQPKRPPHAISAASYSPGTPMTNLPSSSYSNAGEIGVETQTTSGRGDPVPLDGQGKERRLQHQVSKGASLAHTSVLDADVTIISANDGRDGRSIRGQASRDGLLSKSDFKGVKADVSRTSLHSKDARKKSDRTSSIQQQTKSTSMIRRTGQKGYKLHQGANRFFLAGFIMTSDDNPLPFLASLVVMIALPALWFVFVAPYTWHHISPAPVIVFGYLFAVAITSMCVTAWRDPGVIPRDLDPDPPCRSGEDGEFIDTSDPLAVPLPRIVRVRNGTDLKVKWCDTCGTYRPPRCSHCRVCDNCVENIDHHCTFLNTCIGRRNYFTFFAFLIASILCACISIVFCVLHIYYLTRSTQTPLPAGGFGEGKSFRQALKATPLSVVLFFLSIAVLIPITTLFSYHIRLICLNRTTVEQIRINTTNAYSEKPNYDEEAGEGGSIVPQNAFHRCCARILPCFNLGVPGRDPNPFAYRSMLRNVRAALLRPMTADSWMDRYKRTNVDERKPSPGTNQHHSRIGQPIAN
ncbi:hypothetical protein L7F22_044156 [Adiantum nelumboides]|nr:hypothetical protein [Adiantum nelumboides]